MRELILGIDIGGTKLAGGLVTTRGKMAAFLSEPTRAGIERGFDQVVKMIERLLEQAGGRHRVAAVGISAPGPLDPVRGVILNPPNLPGWRRVRLGEMVRRRFRLPVRVENDANAAGLAETLFGAARGCRDAFYVTVSTGIGTGIIIDGRIYHGRDGMAGEGGHVTIDYQSAYRCGCGSQGCIEAIASGPAIARRARVRLQGESTEASRLRDLVKGDLDRLTAEVIGQAARAGDGMAQSIIDETGFYLGVWLAGMINLLDPEAVVIGGGVSRLGGPFFRRIRETVLARTYTIQRHRRRTPIRLAKLGAQVGVFGAASLFLTDKDRSYRPE